MSGFALEDGLPGPAGPGDPGGGVAEAGASGLYGKLACKGDFITRRLSRDLVKPLDTWLQDSLAGSRDRLGPAWLSTYLTAPIWRFAMAPGACGEETALGIWMPSIDRVGRHYPLVLGGTFGRDSNCCALYAAAGDWFAALENLALSTLDDGFDFEAFDRDLQALTLPATRQTWSGVIEERATARAWRMELPPEEPGELIHANILNQALSLAHGPFSLWWCQGSDRLAPSLLAAPGLPDPDRFTAMLDGRWRQWGWADTGLVDPLSLDAPDPDLGI